MLSLRQAYGNNHNKPKPPETIAAKAMTRETNSPIKGGSINAEEISFDICF